MRDLVVLLFIMAAIPLAMSSVSVAFLLWAWAGLVAINFYAYGFMRSVPVVLVFALITLAMIALGRIEGSRPFQMNRTSWLLLALSSHGFLSAAFAFEGLPRNWELFSDLAKTVLLCLVMPMVLVDRKRINLFVLIVVVSITFHGILDGLKFIASGGGHLAAGLSKFGDNNHYALVLLMVMPFLLYVYRYASARIVRLMAVGVGVLTFLAMIATHSRGALVTLFAIGLWIIFVGKRRIGGVMIVLVLSTLAFQFAPSNWFDRMDSIGSASEDASFMGRVTAWKRASAIALEHPWLGGGFHAGQGGGEIFERFRYKQGLLGFVDTPDVSYAAASHSIYFQVVGDLGFFGLLIFTLCLANVFYCRREILQMAKDKGAEFRWAVDLANATAAGVLAFMVGGALLSAAYFELPYYLMMFMQCIKLSLSHRTKQP